MNIRMPLGLKPHFRNELIAYEQQLEGKNWTLAWTHLERAHIIGQLYPYEHSLTHWKMLLFGIKIKNLREVVGQIPRLLVGGVKSFIGTIPTGNTGGANISALAVLPIPPDIMELFQKNGIKYYQDKIH